MTEVTRQDLQLPLRCGKEVWGRFESMAVTRSFPPSPFNTPLVEIVDMTNTITDSTRLLH